MSTWTLVLPDSRLVASQLQGVSSVNFRLWVAWDGVNYQDESAAVVSMTGTESADLSTRYLGSSEVTVTLDNTSRRYSIDNPGSPLAPYLNHVGQPAYVEMGYGGYYARVGTFHIETLHGNELDLTCELHLMDQLSTYQDTYVSLPPQVNLDTGAIFGLLCQAGGLVKPTSGVKAGQAAPLSNYSADTGETTVPYCVAAQSTLLGELQQVAQAEGGRVFLDPYGVLQFWCKSHHEAALQTPVVTLTRSRHVFDISFPRLAQALINRFTLEYDTRQNVTVAETVYQHQGYPIACAQPVIYNGTVYAVLTKLELQAMDMVRWERYLPVNFGAITTITANTAPDGSGTAITLVNSTLPQQGTLPPSNTVYYQWSPKGSTGTLELWSYVNGPAYITALVISGTPQRTVSPYSVQADDLTGQQLNGGVIVEQRMTNAYLPTTDVAMQRAQNELLYRSGMLARVDLPDVDGMPYLHPYDSFVLIDDFESPAVMYMLQCLKNEWSLDNQGYRSKITCGPAMPSSVQTLIAIMPVPGVGTPVLASGQPGPYQWAPGADPLSWGAGTWD